VYDFLFDTMTVPPATFVAAFQTVHNTGGDPVRGGKVSV